MPNELKTVKPYKVKARNNLGTQFYNIPARNYLSLTCPIDAENKSRFPSACWLSCGLACAARCFRAPDAVCEGCPCLAIDQKCGCPYTSTSLSSF